MLSIRDYDGNEYALRAVKVHTSELNGQDDLELTVHQQQNNNLDLKTIDKMWEIEYLNIDYKIIYVKQQTKGDSFYLEIRAIPLFYWDMDKQIIHDNLDGSYTAAEFFRIVFADSGYDYTIVDFSSSVEFEGLGKGETRKEMFKRGLDRYDYEFDMQGTTVYLRHLTGNDTNFMYKYKLNASNVSKTTDASAMFTHIKGFGNFEDGEEDYYNNAKLKRQYTSPLADIVTRPGKQPDEGKPIVDGRVTQASTLDKMMQKSVEESLAVTVEGTLHDIRKMGYDIAVPLKGDRVFLLDERIDLKIEIRVHSVVTTYDEKDNIVDCQVTFGSESIRGRHKSEIAILSKNFADLLEGKLKLPRISLDNIARGMIEAIHAASSEIVFGDFGMQAISKTNPNHVFGVNSEGWYISQDGGRTPRTIATAQGIYADALFAGTLWLTNDMNIEGQTGYLNITGEKFIMRSKKNKDTFVEISADKGVHISDGLLQVDRDDGGYPTIIAGRNTAGQRIMGSVPMFMHPQLEITGQRIVNDSTEMRTIDAFYFEHFFNALMVYVAVRNNGNAAYTVRVGVEGFTNFNVNHSETIRTVPNDTVYMILRVPIGIPDGKRKQFYIQFAPIRENISARISILDVKNFDM